MALRVSCRARRDGPKWTAAKDIFAAVAAPEI